MNIEIQTIGAKVAAAAINGVFQGILIAVFAGLVLRLLGRTNAATRHAVWFASLLLLAFIIPAQFWLEGHAPALNTLSQAHPERLSSAAKSQGILFEPSSAKKPFELNPIDSMEGATEATPGVSPAWDSPAAPPTMESEGDKEPEIASPPYASFTHRVPTTRFEELGGVLRRGFLLAGERGAALVSWRIETQLGRPFLATFFALWLFIAGARLLLLLRGLRQMQKLADGSWPAGLELLAVFERLRARSGIRRVAELRVSVQHRSPLVLGFVRPVILLPANLATVPELLEAEQVLTHELAHVRRYDDWANLVQHFIQAVLFFHPAVWWIGKRLSLEREVACDDFVLEQGGGRRSYALALTSVASRIQQRTPMLAPGVSNGNSQLQQRISMILNTRRNSSPNLAKGRLTSIVSATAVIAVLALYTGPRFLLAQTAATPKSASITTGTTSVIAAPAMVASTGEAVSPTPAVATVLAQAAAPEPPIAGVDSGPKFKPENPKEDPAEPAEVTPPEAPDAPNINVNVDVAPEPMLAPRVARAGKPGKVPRSFDADRDGSIEERLKRLEKMVESLMSQQNPKHSHASVNFKDGTDFDLKFEQKETEKLKESAERQASRAAEQAKRAAEQYKRAAKEFEAFPRAEQERGKGEPRESLQRELEALRKARENLGQEMERLDRQIQKLEKDHQRGEREQQRRSETRGERLQTETSATLEPPQ